jgi:hypothetical protein
LVELEDGHPEYPSGYTRLISIGAA